MPEVLTASRVLTGAASVTDGAVVIGDRTVDWAGPAAALPAEYAALPRQDYPDSTILRGLIDSHVHLGFDGGPNPAVVARGRDYVPDSGRFDVSAPGTPFASPGSTVNMELLNQATRRRRV